MYGGGRVGLMGAVADAALAAGGDVVGVIPEFLRAREAAHGELRLLRLDKDLPLPRRSHDIDAGIDLFSAEDVEIGPGQRHLTGILPEHAAVSPEAA